VLFKLLKTASPHQFRYEAEERGSCCMDKLFALMIVFAFMIAMAGAAILAIRWKRKSSQRAALLGLGLELFGGRHEPASTGTCPA
jgi:hypothetical protein